MEVYTDMKRLAFFHCSMVTLIQGSVLAKSLQGGQFSEGLSTHCVLL
jgi:hypothetical protein